MKLSTSTTINSKLINHKQKIIGTIAVLATRKKKSTVRLTKNSKIIKTIINAIQEKKGENIISLDLRKINEAVADFFIICEASNQPQVRAIADIVEHEMKKKCDENPYHHEGMKNLQWVLIDYVNVVVHVMLRKQENFINWKKCGVMRVTQEHEEN